LRRTIVGCIWNCLSRQGKIAKEKFNLIFTLVKEIGSVENERVAVPEVS
jgi:hypothetical protein